MPATQSRAEPRSTSQLAALTIVLAYGIAWGLYVSFAPDYRYLPTAENIALLLVVVLAAGSVRNPYARYLFFFWALWFVVGSFSLFAQNQLTRGLNYNIDANLANRVYLLCILAGILGALVAQGLSGVLHGAYVGGRPRKLPLPFWIGFLIFPVLYAVTIVQATGDVPLFSGRDVSAEMYEVDYGPLHSFGIYVTVACVMIWIRAHDPNVAAGLMRKTIALALIAGYLVLAATDGRRVFPIFAIVGMIISYLGLSRRYARWVWIALVGSAGLIGYVSAAVLRTGRDFSNAFDSFYALMATIGTEYRDFVYVFDRYPPGRLELLGYDWFGSTMASLTPGFILSLLGYDKFEMTVHDSARSLMPVFGVQLGIRIGLPGELWLAYGWWALPLFGLVGALIVWFANQAIRATHLVYRSILFTIIAIFALAVLGQSTVTFGLLLPLAYLAIIVAIAEAVLPSPGLGHNVRN